MEKLDFRAHEERHDTICDPVLGLIAPGRPSGQRGL